MFPASYFHRWICRTNLNLLHGSYTQTDQKQYSSSVVGLETIHCSHTNLFLSQGKRGKGAAAKENLPQWPWILSGKLLLLSVSTGQCKLTPAVRSPPGHMLGTHRDVCPENPLGHNEWDGPTEHPEQHGASTCSMHRTLQRVWGDVWIKCVANGSARLGAWPWKHLASLLQTRLVCDCPPWSSALWLRNANVLRVRALLFVTVLSFLLAYISVSQKTFKPQQKHGALFPKVSSCT